MNCREARPLIHDYLDGALEGSTQQLQQHLQACVACREELERLERTDAFIRHMPALDVSAGFTDRVMKAVPKPSPMTRLGRWVKLHPAASVAVVFIMVMLSSFFSLWDREHTLVVKGNDLEDIIIEGNVVIVPEGRTVDGNLTVENGELHVFGEVVGNLVVVDGKAFVASTASIGGEETYITQRIDYFWFKVKQFFSGFSRE